MAHSTTNKVLELFGHSTRVDRTTWGSIVASQQCPFTETKCFKVRKSQSDISIGTCTMRFGRDSKDLLICPKRLLERKKVFTDCFHLLTLHEPGNDLHIVPEISIPGGHVDYFLASTRNDKVKDFVAIEFQTMDTTGTIWPERQRLLREFGVDVLQGDVDSAKPFGINWKMTAKTILVQLHHKVDTLEHISKHFVLVIQNHLLDYLKGEFHFDHLGPARIGDTFHVHSYALHERDQKFSLSLDTRISTDGAGVAKALGLQAETKIELEAIIAELEKKISDRTLFTLDGPPPTSVTEVLAE